MTPDHIVDRPGFLGDGWFVSLYQWVGQAGFDGGFDPWFRPRRKGAFWHAKTGRYPPELIPELIERGIRLALDSKRPIAHVAADLGINAETLRKKVNQLLRRPVSRAPSRWPPQSTCRLPVGGRPPGAEAARHL